MLQYVKQLLLQFTQVLYKEGLNLSFFIIKIMASDLEVGDCQSQYCSS